MELIIGIRNNGTIWFHQTTYIWIGYYPFHQKLPVSFLTYLHLSGTHIIGLWTCQGMFLSFFFFTGPIINFLIPISHMGSGSESVSQKGELLHHRDKLPATVGFDTEENKKWNMETWMYSGQQ